MGDDGVSPLEQVARSIHDGNFRRLGLDPPDWEKLRKKDRQGYLAQAEKVIATWELALMRVQGRRWKP